MPPKRKRAETEAGIATRSTRKSTRTEKNRGNVNTNTSASSAETESTPSKKARTTAVKATSARSRSSRAVLINDDRLVSPLTNPEKNDQALEDIKLSTKVPASEQYSPQRSRNLFQNFADPEVPGIISPEGVEKLCMEFGCSEVGKITLEEWLRGTDALRISSLPILATALRELDDLVIQNKEPIKRPSSSAASMTRRTSPNAMKTQELYNKSRYWDYAQDADRAFGELYQFCFTSSKPPQSRNMDMETATALWSVLLSARYPIISDITTFLNENSSYRGANKDIWNMVYEFCRTINPNLDNYEDDAAWPTLLDDFVSWKRGKSAGGTNS
ncbi:Cullin binding-domain-containing protein [Pisolithus marmoratus]|nr:Cullin binding-domain-containing protein [Pisolithus marmoratus]